MSQPEASATWVLRAVVAVAVGAAVGSLLVPGGAATALGWTAVGLAAAGPVLRVVLAARDWRRPGDRRFLLAAVGLAAMVAAGALLGR